MIPQNLHWAFEEGHRIQTPGGTGKTERRKLADLVLPSGNLLIGYPGEDMVNISSDTYPHIAPGTYPVFVTLARHKNGFSTVAFVTVSFLHTEAVSWEKTGSFFTDSGDGLILDAGFIDLLKQKRREMSLQQWQQLKMGALEGGDGNLILDEKTGSNAIVFRACDWSYDCFAGRDSANNITCLVIDGRVFNPHENRIVLAFRTLLGD